MPTRAERTAATRAAIERAALTLFVRDGYAATHVSHVADAAGVSRRTVFRHFARKEDLIFSDADDDTGVVLAALAERPPGEPAGPALARALVACSGHYDRDVIRGRVIVVERSPELMGHAWVLRQRWIQAVAGALARRAGDDGVSPRTRLQAAVANMVLSDAVVRWAVEDAAGRPLASHVEAALADLATMHGLLE